jgi:DNA mismatch repair protein MutH
MIRRGECGMRAHPRRAEGTVDVPMGAPPTLDDLMARARALRGRTLDTLAAERGLPWSGRDGARTKGKTGALLEALLGASGGSAAVVDFPELGVELKTIPVDHALRPRESTYVCTLPLAAADRAEWSTSWARAKLSRVLWVPIVDPDAAPRVGEPLLWEPTPEQAAVLAADFDEIVGTIALGGIEGVTARIGRWLHVRPKAASSRERTWASGVDGEWIATVPRGLYLRSRFTGALLRDPRSVP